MASRYWVLDAGTWDNSTTTHWSTSSGGLGGASVPGASDTVILDANSCLLNGTITVNTDFNISAMTTGAFTGTLDFSVNNNSPTMASWNGAGTGTRTFKYGNGTFTLTGTSGNVWDLSTNTGYTHVDGTWTIKITDTTSANTFAGGGLTYNNLYINRTTNTNSFTISGSNSFNNIKDDGTVAHSILFTNSTTQTVASFNVSGSAGKLITLSNSSGTTPANLAYNGGSFVSCDYLNIAYLNATPTTNVWYAGSHSNNTGGADTGWIFLASPNEPVPSSRNNRSFSRGRSKQFFDGRSQRYNRR